MIKDKTDEPAIIEVFHEIAENVGYLKCRWQDEREYEDFNDYIAKAKEWVEEQGAKFISMDKRFTLIYEKDGFVATMKTGARSIDLTWMKPA